MATIGLDKLYWRTMVESVTVYSSKNITVRFRSGTDIRVSADNN